MARLDPIQLGGSEGEGGGQILRTALALAMVTGRGFRLSSIRAGRARPGLLRQHLTAVQAAAEICRADVTGARLGATELAFFPGEVTPGEYRFAIGSAGSASLVLQTVLPALMTAAAPSTVTVEGGTHNPSAPRAPFLQHAFAPILERMGVGVTIELQRHGFYPAGGGRLCARIEPAPALRPLELLARGEIRHRRATAMVAGLPGEIARRELAVVAATLGWDDDCLRIEQLDDRVGPGNALTVEVASEHVTEVFTGFGQRGVSAEEVAAAAAAEAQAYLAAEVAVWDHLADQLMIPLAMAGAGAYCTGPLSSHARTNATVVDRFLPQALAIEAGAGGAVTVRAGAG
jgi:RNA 3'-terminal phosphate cyclase (ATP)